MNYRIFAFVGAVLLVGSMAWLFLDKKRLDIDGSTKIRVDSPKQTLVIQESVRKPERAVDSTQTQQSLQSQKEAYEERAKCFGISSESQIELQKDIASLKGGLEHVDAALRGSFERAISQKEEALSRNVSCLSADHPVTKDELHSLLLAAAQSGDVTAQLAYARDPLIDPLQAISRIDELRQWRQLARNYVDAAVEAGNFDAILLQAEAADPYRCQASNNEFCAGLFTNLVNEDPNSAYMNYYLASLLNPEQTPSWVKDELSALETLLSSDDVAIAKQTAMKKYNIFLKQ